MNIASPSKVLFSLGQLKLMAKPRGAPKDLADCCDWKANRRAQEAIPIEERGAIMMSLISGAAANLEKCSLVCAVTKRILVLCWTWKQKLPHVTVYHIIADRKYFSDHARLPIVSSSTMASMGVENISRQFSTIEHPAKFYLFWGK